jgi:hypothetical protein
MKRKSEAWVRLQDVLLTKRCTGQKGWGVSVKKTGRQEGGVREKVGRVPERGQIDKGESTAQPSDQTFINEDLPTGQMVSIQRISLYFLSVQQIPDYFR